MQTPQQKILSLINEVATATQLNVVEYTNYESLKQSRIAVKHFSNGNELSICCPTKLITHDYLFIIFNELNKTDNDNN